MTISSDKSINTNHTYMAPVLVGRVYGVHNIEIHKIKVTDFDWPTNTVIAYDFETKKDTFLDIDFLKKNSNLVREVD